jgi:hypothetical protein
VSDHTIIIVSKRSDKMFLEFVSKSNLNQLILLQATYMRLSHFDIVNIDPTLAYILLCDGLVGCILKVVAGITTSNVSAVPMKRSSPTDYVVSCAAVFDFAKCGSFKTPLVSVKVVVNRQSPSTDVITLAAVDSGGQGFLFHSDGSCVNVGNHFEDLIRLENVLDTKPYIPYVIFKTNALDAPFQVWTPTHSAPIAVTALERGTFFAYHQGIILWNLVCNLTLQLRPVDATSVSKYLPSQVLNTISISFPYIVLAEAAVVPTSDCEALLPGLLEIAYSSTTSSALLLDGIEQLMKSEVERRGFDKSSPVFVRLLTLLHKQDPLLMLEILSSTTRKLEPSVVQTLFPLPLESRSSRYTQVDLFTL